MTYTVKAFKPFELISEEKDTFDEAATRFAELRSDPHIDAAYIYLDGEIFQAWSDDYDHPDGGEYIEQGYVHDSGGYNCLQTRDEHGQVAFIDIRPFQRYWMPNNKPDFELAKDHDAEFYYGARRYKIIACSTETGKPLDDLDLFGNYGGVLSGEMNRETAGHIEMLYNTMFDACRLLRAAQETMTTDLTFSADALQCALDKLYRLMPSDPSKWGKDPLDD